MNLRYLKIAQRIFRIPNSRGNLEIAQRILDICAILVQAKSIANLLRANSRSGSAIPVRSAPSDKTWNKFKYDDPGKSKIKLHIISFNFP